MWRVLLSAPRAWNRLRSQTTGLFFSLTLTYLLATEPGLTPSNFAHRAGHDAPVVQQEECAAG